MGSSVPELLEELRTAWMRKTGKPMDPDIMRLTTQIEVRTASAPTIIMGEEYGLSPKQSEILSHLARYPGMIFRRDAILNALYSDRVDQPDPKLFDVMLCNIRRKLLKHNAPYWVETIWGQGFKFVNTPASKGKLYRVAHARAA